MEMRFFLVFCDLDTGERERERERSVKVGGGEMMLSKFFCEDKKGGISMTRYIYEGFW